MKRIAHREPKALLVACALLFSAVAYAQDASAITGTVVDSATKKPVADVVVTATSPALAAEQMAVTDKDGAYRIPELPVGEYALRFESSKHRPFSRSGISVRAGTAVKFDTELLPEAGLSEELVVTGSRIPRPEVDKAAPVTVVGRAQIEASGKAGIGDVLQMLPEQGNAMNAQVNNGGDGAQRVDLRSLGAGRTLVLVNGRRHVAGGTGANSTVDLNTIPTQAVERVEVLKDGASAIYGSDAIAGVVNIITKKDYAGTEVNVFSGISQHGDGLFYDVSATTGQASARGNILFSAGFFKQTPAWAGDRKFSYFDYTYDWSSHQYVTTGSSATPQGRLHLAGTVSDPNNEAYDPNAGTQAWKDLLAAGGTSFMPDPTNNNQWRRFKATGVTEAGGDFYNYQPANYLVTPSQRANVFATGGLNLGDTTRAFFEMSYTNRQTQQKLAPEPLFTDSEGIAVTADNVYNPFGIDIPVFRRRLVEFGNRIFTQDLDTFRVVTGIEGTIPALANWSWNAAFNYGRTQGVETKEGLLQRSRVAAAIGPSFYDAATDSYYCGTPGAEIEGCVPLDLFNGAGAITDEMKNYLTYKGTARGFNQQVSVNAGAGGVLFTLPSSKSPVGLAFGVEHRREAGANIPDPLTAKGDTTGNKARETGGGYNVSEGYVELSIPLLGNLLPDSQADLLELNGALRAFNYSTFGAGTTYKLGARLTPVQDVTVRGTLSNAFRAPSIGELYAGAADSFPDASDPCSDRVNDGGALDSKCDAQGVPQSFSDDRGQLKTQIGGGGDNLKPETADIFTVGLVFQPRMVKDFSATFDVYSIKITDTITNLTADVILNDCYEGTGTYCDRIQRNPDTKMISVIEDRNTNVGADAMGGFDLGARYEPMTPYGRVGVMANFTKLNYMIRTLATGENVYARNTYDLEQLFVDWKGTAGLTWALDPVNAGLNVRYVNGFQECENNSCKVVKGVAPNSRRVDAYATVDLNVGYKLDMGNVGKTTVMAGVNNLFDQQPPRVYNGFTADSDPTAYDFMGRFFYVRLQHSFY